MEDTIQAEPCSPTEVTVVIVTFNSAHVIGRCLDAIPPDVSVVVVDNASGDETSVAAGAARPDVAIVRNTANLGYGTAANRGLAQVMTPYALLINPDTILMPQTIPELLAAARRHPDSAIFGPLVVDTEGRPAAGYRPAAPLMTAQHPLFEKQLIGALPSAPAELTPRADESGTDQAVGSVCGCALFFRLSALARIGGFDERIFLFYEESDLCYRALLAGMPPIHVRAAPILHLGQSSVRAASPQALGRFRLWHQEWSRFHLMKLYGRAPGAQAIMIYHLFLYGTKALRYHLTGRHAQSWTLAARFGGAWASFRGHPADRRLEDHAAPFATRRSRLNRTLLP